MRKETIYDTYNAELVREVRNNEGKIAHRIHVCPVIEKIIRMYDNKLMEMKTYNRYLIDLKTSNGVFETFDDADRSLSEYSI